MIIITWMHIESMSVGISVAGSVLCHPVCLPYPPWPENNAVTFAVIILLRKLSNCSGCGREDKCLLLFFPLPLPESRVTITNLLRQAGLIHKLLRFTPPPPPKKKWIPFFRHFQGSRMLWFLSLFGQKKNVIGGVREADNYCHLLPAIKGGRRGGGWKKQSELHSYTAN